MPAMPHRLHYRTECKTARPAKSKIAKGVWKGVCLLIFGSSCHVLLIFFLFKHFSYENHSWRRKEKKREKICENSGQLMSLPVDCLNSDPVTDCNSNSRANKSRHDKKVGCNPNLFLTCRWWGVLPQSQGSHVWGYGDGEVIPTHNIRATPIKRQAQLAKIRQSKGFCTIW